MNKRFPEKYKFGDVREKYEHLSQLIHILKTLRG